MEVVNPQPRFVIQKCSLVTQWAWDTINDCCPICRNSVNEDSITNENNPNMTSVVVVGMCGHAFHYECINRWLKNSKNCPLCNSTWEFQKTMDKSVINNNNVTNLTTDQNNSASDQNNVTSTYVESGSQTVTPSVSINVTSTNLDNIPISPIQATNEISEMIVDDDDDNQVSWDNDNNDENDFFNNTEW